MAKADDAFKSSFINRKAGTRDRQALPRLREAQGQRPAPQGRQAADGPRQRHAAADEPRADRRRGNGAALLPADERAEPQDLREATAAPTSPTRATSTAPTGGSASTCCSSSATSAWSPAASTAWIPDFEGLDLPPSIEKLCHLRPGHGAAGRRHRLGQEHDDRLDAQLDQPHATASTSSRSKTRSNSSSPKTSA